MEVSYQKFPILQYIDLQPPLIYCHKLW